MVRETSDMFYQSIFGTKTQASSDYYVFKSLRFHLQENGANYFHPH